MSEVDYVDAEGNCATTCLRLAFKAFQMRQFGFSLGNLDHTKGIIVNAPKEKLDNTNNWVYSPFHSYKCKKKKNHFILVTKHDHVACVDCSVERVNKRCSYKRCKKCWIKFAMTSQQCQSKDHNINANAVRPKLIQGELLVEGVDDNYN